MCNCPLVLPLVHVLPAGSSSLLGLCRGSAPGGATGKAGTGGYECLCPMAGPWTWKRADQVTSISLSICKYLQPSYYKLLV